MTSTYDEVLVADRYERNLDDLPFRYVDSHSILGILGDVSGQSVLDAACGTGYYSRLLRRMRATRVVGVDISENMLRMARAAEAEQPLGIEYVASSIVDFKADQLFDVVLAVYLFSHAHTLESLHAFCRVLGDSMRTGGRLVSYAANSGFDVTPRYYRPYGLDIHARPGMKDGDQYAFSLLFGDMNPTFQVFYWQRATIQEALQHAGFEHISWTDASISDGGIRAYGDPFWEAYRASPHGMVVQALKA